MQRADLARTQRWIEQRRQRAAEEVARCPPPPPPDWVIAYQRTARGSAPHDVHVGGCTMAEERVDLITREQALAALAGGVAACGFCCPDRSPGHQLRGELDGSCGLLPATVHRKVSP
ncbi:DUF6233 domain-containing protein [Streptomyces sp. cg36]|uniref:DUF6233 domain-containing protein n=1 Tax=Streptomyces sp. cg36 TaxID=3238798 RepID=UPI0034E25502